MLCVLDMLLSREFQSKCTWTGASRKGPKIAIMPNRNILQLFVQIGSDESEVVTQRKLANFFMRKLKNSLKRLATTGMRRGTRHVRRRKQKNADGNQVQPGGVDGSIVAVSNEPCKEDDERDVSSSLSESEDAISVVNSSDGLDRSDIQSDSSASGGIRE